MGCACGCAVICVFVRMVVRVVHVVRVVAFVVLVVWLEYEGLDVCIGSVVSIEWCDIGVRCCDLIGGRPFDVDFSSGY